MQTKRTFPDTSSNMTNSTTGSAQQSSIIMTVDLQTPPEALQNPLSFSTALLAAALQKTGDIPVLSSFCMHRNNDSPAETTSGPTALVMSLNAQLIEFIAEHRPEADLSPLEGYGLVGHPKRMDLKDQLRLLDTLFSELPAGEAVYVVIDQLAWLSGRDKDADKVMKKLSGVIERREGLVVKMVVTGALPASFVVFVSVYIDPTKHFQTPCISAPAPLIDRPSTRPPRPEWQSRRPWYRGRRHGYRGCNLVPPPPPQTPQ
ncbi:hypothetical protein B0T17DRAFT_110671 [Bombardia bombarda]|uniref:Uncharacterized protein n=1 Tax=Bombardia bombarda TaxID=252184 RepID=A0AA39T0Z1_9PEZI|nr:hypothetical protein B0T17DRAFT_110671 [Bombardia bombarda]